MKHKRREGKERGGRKEKEASEGLREGREKRQVGEEKGEEGR